ncbi:MAG: hypothetical protein C4290_12820 [Chloroflexota bacterium]
MNGQINRQRVSRRTALHRTVLGGAGLAFLAACGKKEPGTGQVAPGQTAAGQQATQAPSILSERDDSTARAVPGGIFQSSTTADVTNLDPLASPSFTANVVGGWVYPRLLAFKPGYKVPATGEIELTELAESLEQPEPTRLILKLRRNAVWDERPPTNRRTVDAEDVVFSWKKFEAQSISRQDLANKVSPAAPILSVEAIDPFTVALTLAFPYAPLPVALAYSRYLQIMPREADGGFDPRNETRGAGAWVLATYQRSVKFEFRKNPHWFRTGRPFLDGFDIPIIPEYAAGLAQFRAKRLWSFAVRQEDIIATKKDLPELLLFQAEFSRACWLIYFGLQPGSPFLDERVRRATSMLIDRDAWIDTFYDVTRFKKEGWPVDVRWHSHISSGYEGIWIDPRGAEIGEGGKNFAFNPAEAKKLLQAAGYPNGIETEIRWITTGQYGTTFPKQAELFKDMLEEGGAFKLKQINPDYQTDYLPKIYFGKGDFKGIAVGAATAYADVGQYLFAYYHAKGPRQKVAFQGQGGDARSDALIEAQLRELDRTKRVALIKDWQRSMATKMLMIPFPGQSPAFSLVWPWVGNAGVFRAYDGETAPQETSIHLWFDKSKYTG